jgi:hypothetical protein
VGVIWLAQAVGRIVAMAFNYTVVRKIVFITAVWRVAPKYVLLVAGNGAVSYARLTTLRVHAHFGVKSAKVVAETLLFAVSFTIQRDFILVRPNTRQDAVIAETSRSFSAGASPRLQRRRRRPPQASRNRLGG